MGIANILFGIDIHSNKLKIKKMKGIDKKLDDAWSLAVKTRAGFKCEVCGSTDKQLNSHHIVGRTNRMTRWEVRNGVCLCVAHHKFGKQSAHEDPLWFTEWLGKNRKNDVEYINGIKNTIKKWQTEEKEELLKQLKQIK